MLVDAFTYWVVSTQLSVTSAQPTNASPSKNRVLGIDLCQNTISDEFLTISGHFSLDLKARGAHNTRHADTISIDSIPMISAETRKHFQKISMKRQFHLFSSVAKAAVTILFIITTTTASAGYRTLMDSNRYVTISTETVGVESVWFCYPDKLECDVTTTNVAVSFSAAIRIAPQPDWELLTEDGTGTVSERIVIMHPGEQVKYRVRHKDTGELSPWGLVVMFRADAILDDVGENAEATDGAFLPEVPSTLSPNDEAFREACRTLRFDLLPVNPPTPDQVTLTWSGVRVFEIGEDGTWSEIQSGVKYPWNELSSKSFRVAGVTPSTEELDYWIKVEHQTNKCTDTAWLTVVHVLSVEVAGRGWPEREWVNSATIAAGALPTEPHQADVRVTVFPNRVDMPFLVRLEGGLGHTEEFDAALMLGGQSLRPLGDYQECSSGAGGVTEGCLTSSDVVGETGTVRASTKSATVSFVWDEFEEDDEWVLDPDYIPSDGTVRNRFRLRLHKEASDDSPFQPLTGHEVRMFIEEVVIEDEDGNRQTFSNTPDSPTDLSAWVSFADESGVCDSNGEVELMLEVKRDNVVFVQLVAYDWTVYSSTRTPPLRKVPRKVTTSVDERERHESRTTSSVNNSAGGPYLILYPNQIPVSPSDELVSQFKNARNLSAMVGGVVRVWPYFSSGTSYRKIFKCNVRFRKQSSTESAWKTITTYATASAKTEGFYLHESVDTAWDYIIKPDEPGTYSCEVQYWKKSGDALKTFSFQFSVFTCSLTAKNPLFQFTDDTAPWAAFLHRRSTSEINPTTSIELQPQPDANGIAPNAIIVSDPAGFLKNGNNIVSATSETSGIVCGVGRFPCPYTQIPISSEMSGNSLVLSVETKTSMVIPMNRAGCLQPIGLAVFDMYIVSPSGVVPPNGEAGNSVEDTDDDTLWVFDKENDGKCHVTCKAAPLSGISDENVKKEIWKRLDWFLPNCGGVSPVLKTDNGDGTWNYDYPVMPSANSSFGTKPDGVKLSIKGANVEPWKQSIQFRFMKNGTGASKDNDSDHVHEGDPNWYVYWQQAIRDSVAGIPDECIYSSENTIDGKYGAVHRHAVSSTSQLECDIKVSDSCSQGILHFAKCLAHEAGHHKSLWLSLEKGGWGDSGYDASNDVDLDYIPDSWEESSPWKERGFSPSKNDSILRENWDHGWWQNSEELSKDPLSRTDDYINVNGYDQATGAGACVDFEKKVDDAEQIETHLPGNGGISSKDWSAK